MASSMHSSLSDQGASNNAPFESGGGGDDTIYLHDESFKHGIIIVPMLCALMVFCIILLCTSILHRRISNWDQQRGKGRSIGRTKDVIWQSFEANRNQMIVKKEDLKYESHDIEFGVDVKHEMDEDNNGGGLLILRVGDMDEKGQMDQMVEAIDTEEKTAYCHEKESTKATPIKRQVVPDCCAICLEFYKVGETVVWSSTLNNNKSSENNISCCPHVYHKECFIEYIMTHKGQGNPCPLCRQEYLPTQQPTKE